MQLAAFFRDVFFLPEAKQAPEICRWTDLTATYQTQISECYLDSVFVALPYTDDIRRQIHAMKYEKSSKDTSRFLKMFQAILPSAECTVVYPPIHWASRLRRGRNHMKLLTKGISNTIDTPFVRRRSQHQARLDKQGRQKNTQHAYRLKPGIKYAQQTIFLLDDVISTGSTANTLARLLKQSGATRVEGYFLTSSNPDYFSAQSPRNNN